MKMLMFFFLMDSFPLVILNNIPVAVWNINGNSLPLKPVPIFSQNGEFYNEVLNSVSQKDLHLLIFTIDKLSSEDFSVRHTQRNKVSKYLENYESNPITLRRLLQSADVVAKDIINVKDCILFYASAVNLIVEPLYNESFSLSSPNTDSSECTPTKTKLVLSYPVGKDIGQFNITFLFKNRGFYWQTYLGLYMAVKKVNYKLPITFCNVTIGAPYGKSYFSEGARIKSILSKFQVSVYFTKLQVQPFAVKDKVFSKAFVETPSWNFMTIAIWEGVFIAILSIVIIKWGIFHLLNVSSMERFDDAKDKTASVSIVTPK